MTPPTSLAAKAAPTEFEVKRLRLMEGRFMLNALQREKDKDGWKFLPKAGRERALAVLHLARQVEHDLGLDTEDYTVTIRALEALAEEPVHGMGVA